MRTKVRDRAPHWRKQDAVKDRYLRLCERMHMPSELHELTFEHSADGLSMSSVKTLISLNAAIYVRQEYHYHGQHGLDDGGYRTSKS